MSDTIATRRETDELDEKREYVRQLEATIERYRDVLSGIQSTDKTPTYEYPKTKGRQAQAALNRDGMVPEPGRRWQTPREAASWALRNL